ncbi:hypothetical protein GS988_25040, partial [Rhodococcus hoagii]|nr:hypothetical protein [Prescottella equi]
GRAVRDLRGGGPRAGGDSGYVLRDGAALLDQSTVVDQKTDLMPRCAWASGRRQHRHALPEDPETAAAEKQSDRTLIALVSLVCADTGGARPDRLVAREPADGRQSTNRSTSRTWA